MMALRWRVQELGAPERWNPHNLAEATGLAYSTVWAIWSNKTRRADLDTIEKIAAALKVEPGNLIGHEPAAGE
jgi:DNA-binding Xre family transcriptional regulator